MVMMDRYNTADNNKTKMYLLEKILQIFIIALIIKNNISISVLCSNIGF